MGAQDIDGDDLVMDVIHLDERLRLQEQTLRNAREDTARGDEAWQKVEEDIKTIWSQLNFMSKNILTIGDDLTKTIAILKNRN